jgi:hypothetical protein
VHQTIFSRVLIVRIDMKYRSFFTVLISIAMLLSLLSCMKREPIRIYDESEIAPAEAARVSIPADITVESVDGHRVKTVADYILSTVNEIHVAPGEHEIVVRYSTSWEYDKKKHEEINSENITLKFKAKRGGHYKLTHPELNDMMAAKKFAENPDIRIEKDEKFADYETEDYRVSHPVETSESKRYTEVEKSPTMEKEPSLKEEWDNLSEKDKEEFRKWLEWNNMSEEKREKFREWNSKDDKE